MPSVITAFSRVAGLRGAGLRIIAPAKPEGPDVCPYRLPEARLPPEEPDSLVT